MARSRKKTPGRASEAERREPAVEPQAARPRAGTRVDPAHVIARPPEAAAPDAPKEADTAPAAAQAADVESAAPSAQWSSESPADIIAQVRSHAEQLAAYLRADQKALDHREAQLNAREAELEARTRSARLWLTEQQGDLSEREEAVVARERELEANAAQVARRTDELRKLEHEVEGRSSQIAAAQFAQEQFDTGHGRTSRSSGRPKPTDQAEQILAELQSEIEAQREQLADERRRFDQRMIAEQNALAAARRAAEAEIAETRQSLERRAAHLDEQQATLDQFREEVTRVHRETLEMRVLIEESWRELCQGSLPPKRAESLATARQRLAHRWKLEREELAALKANLEGIAVRLTQQQDKLNQQKRQFQEWLAAQQQEIERHASRLIAREEQVRRQQAQLDDAEQQWQAERRKLKQEVRRLLVEIQRRERASA